jgi:hypothetical protein
MGVLSSGVSGKRHFRLPCLQAGVPELSATKRLTARVVGDVPQYAFVPVWNCAKRLTFADSG